MVTTCTDSPLTPHTDGGGGDNGRSDILDGGEDW